MNDIPPPSESELLYLIFELLIKGLLLSTYIPPPVIDEFDELFSITTLSRYGALAGAGKPSFIFDWGAKDFLFIWAPLYKAKNSQGGLLIFKDSHKKGYQKHHFDNKLGSAQVSKEIINKFEKKIIEVDAGSALLIHSALIHGSIKTKKKRFARFVLCDRLCPLVKLPYLRKEKAPIKIPYVGVDYNAIVD